MSEKRFKIIELGEEDETIHEFAEKLYNELKIFSVENLSDTLAIYPELLLNSGFKHGQDVAIRKNLSSKGFPVVEQNRVSSKQERKVISECGEQSTSVGSNPTSVTIEECNAITVSRYGLRKQSNKRSYVELHTIGMPSAYVSTSELNLQQSKSNQHGGINVKRKKKVVNEEESDDEGDSAEMDREILSQQVKARKRLLEEDPPMVGKKRKSRSGPLLTTDQHISRLSSHKDTNSLCASLKHVIRLFYYKSAKKTAEIVRWLLECGAVHKVVNLIAHNSDEKVVGVAFVALNYCVHCGTKDHLTKIFALGITSILQDKVRSNDELVRIEALWLVANASTVQKYRDLLLQARIIDAISQGFPTGFTAPRSVWCTTMRKLRVFYHYTPTPSIAYMKPAWPVLRCALSSYDPTLVYYALLTLRCIVYREGVVEVRAVFKYGIAAVVLELLRHVSPRVQKAALKVLEHLTVGEPKSVLMLIEYRDGYLLHRLLNVLSTEGVKASQLLSTCRTLCNICACDDKVLTKVIEFRILPAMIALHYRRYDAEILEQIVYAICYAIYGSSNAQLLSIVTVETANILYEGTVWFTHDEDTLTEILDSVHSSLTLCDSVELRTAVETVLKEGNVFKAVEVLKNRDHSDVQEAAEKINMLM